MLERPPSNISIRRGKNVPGNCEIAVIVISTNSDPLARRAAQSILNNTHPCELVVVNTGKGSLKPIIHDILDNLVLIECPQRHYAGGSRNLGIGVTSSPIIAFLAADCIAPSDWIGRRLDAHETNDLVPSSLLPAHPKDGKLTNTCWASYFSTHFERIPGMPAGLGKPFGLSYNRKIFDKYGLYDPSLRTGEDSEYNARIPTYGQLSPLTQVVTLHSYPERLGDAINIQYRRGVHEYRFSKFRYNRSRTVTAARTLKRALLAFLWIVKNNSEHSKKIRKSTHILAALIFVRILGNIFSTDRA